MRDSPIGKLRKHAACLFPKLQPGAAIRILPTSRKVRETWDTLFLGRACGIKARAMPPVGSLFPAHFLFLPCASPVTSTCSFVPTSSSAAFKYSVNCGRRRNKASQGLRRVRRWSLDR
jgi:hypothetical protein